MLNNALTGLGDVDTLVTEVNTELKNRPIAQENIANQLCWIRLGGSSGKIGQTTIFPVQFFGNRSKVRSVYEEIGGTTPEVAKFSVEVQLHAPDGYLLPQMTMATDIYGIVEGNVTDLRASAQAELERQLAELIGTGASTTTVYDGKNFFATDHEANPTKPGLKTFSNYKTSFDLNYANVSTALDLLDAVPGPDGNLLSMPGRNVIFVSTGAQESAARLLMNGDFIPSTAGTATQSNPLKGRADVVKIVQLRDYGSAKYWGVARIAGDKHRPFTLSMPVPPQMYVSGLAIDESLQVTRSVGKMGWKSVHGFGYGWPHLAVLCVES